MRLVPPSEQPAEFQPISRLPSRARPRLHPTLETAMEDPVNKGAELENLPQPPTDGMPAPEGEEGRAEELGEDGEPKWGGTRTKKPGKPQNPGKPPKPEPTWGGTR